MKNIKNFESWKNNIIDKTLFTSGKAKYDPKIRTGVIHYKTGNVEPYYFARIEKRGVKFICKIYKKDAGGKPIRLRNKLKNDLKTAHNYVREFLNQKLKRKDNNKHIKVEKPERIFREDPEIMRNDDPILPPMEYSPPERKTIIRRY
jgi:hypothetical protein